jgi:hypothetical protein
MELAGSAMAISGAAALGFSINFDNCSIDSSGGTSGASKGAIASGIGGAEATAGGNCGIGIIDPLDSLNSGASGCSFL